jgi:pimeloyl-ACP methyl ester carboxylesterase
LKVVSFPQEAISVALLDLPGTDSTATPRVFLHGLGSSARSVLIDLPGFGHSTAPEIWSFSLEDQATFVAGVVEETELPLIDVIGHSMVARSPLPLPRDVPIWSTG